MNAVEPSVLHRFLNVLVREGLRRPRLTRLLASLHNALGGNRTRIRGRGCTVATKGAFLRRCSLEVEGDRVRIDFGPGAIVSDLSARVRGAGAVLEIGPECIFKKLDVCIEDEGSHVRIGAETTMESAAVSATEGKIVQIGEDCMLAPGVDIRNGDSHAILDAATGARINPAADVIVGRHVWLGLGSQILKGAQIGDGAIVAARAVVTGPVPAGSIAAGSPARVVRDGVAWTRRRDACPPDRRGVDA